MIKENVNKKSLQEILEVSCLIVVFLNFFIKSNITAQLTFGEIGLLIMLILVLLKQDEIKIKPFFYPTIIYFFYFLISSAYFILIDKINFVSILYSIKEIVYMTSFFAVCVSYKSNYVFSKKLTKLLLLANAGFGVFSILNRQIAFYGVGSIISAAPSKSGIVYLTCTIISFILLKKTKEKVYIYLLLIHFLLVTATISRTTILGGLAFFVLYFFQKSLTSHKVKLKKNISFKRILLISVLLLTVFIVVYKDTFGINSLYLKPVINRFLLLESSIEIRQNMSTNYIMKIIKGSPLYLLIGRGKSIPEYITGSSTLAVDNQYTRILVEGGVLGVILWVCMVFSWIMYISKNQDKYERNITFSLVGSFLVMGFGYEVFQVSQSGISFWLLLGIIFVNSEFFLKKHNIKSNY